MRPGRDLGDMTVCIFYTIIVMLMVVSGVVGFILRGCIH